MLDQLSVKNLVVVEDLNIEFLHGMTVVTGETGAGKSILVQALNLAIGGRSDSALVRHGKSKAEIIATFSLDGNQSIQSAAAILVFSLILMPPKIRATSSVRCS